MIKPVCAWCGNELEEFGAILFAPPKEHFPLVDVVEKFHCCKKCFEEIKPLPIKNQESDKK